MVMESILIESVKGQGLWTILAVFLLLYTIKTSGDREKRLHNLIDELTEKFNLVEDVQKDVKEIKRKME